MSCRRDVCRFSFSSAALSHPAHRVLRLRTRAVGSANRILRRLLRRIIGAALGDGTFGIRRVLQDPIFVGERRRNKGRKQDAADDCVLDHGYLPVVRGHLPPRLRKKPNGPAWFHSRMIGRHSVARTGASVRIRSGATQLLETCLSTSGAGTRKQRSRSDAGTSS